MKYPEFLWLVITGSFGAFGFGWGTGANDVANAFGTSIGSKTLTLKQAVILASIFEFTGAMVLGRVSTDTIAGGIANINYFVDNPAVYAYGMCCTLFMGFIWQAFASYKEWNVSATHSIIGGIIGFALTYKGKEGVNWITPVTDGSSFPPYKGVVPIVLSWFISPILTGLAAAFIFGMIRTIVLRRTNSYQISFYTIPFIVMLTTWINIYFVFTKGAKKVLTNVDEWTPEKSAWIAAIIAGGLSTVSTIFGIPFLRKRIDKTYRPVDNSYLPVIEEVPKEEELETTQTETVTETTTGNRFSKFLLKGINTDIHADIHKDKLVSDIHENAEIFDQKTEHVFKYLQVFSAICVIFAHGAGEVGYMAGPLGSIWKIVNDGKMVSSVSAPIWVILIGASGLVVGLATYGYNVSRAMGTKLAKLTATRGFAAELATALVILIASQYGLPTSSSQCITGGIVGVGLMEGVRGVNWKLFGATFFSWIGTMFVMGVGTSALFSQGVYAPHRITA